VVFIVSRIALMYSQAVLTCVGAYCLIWKKIY